MNSPHTKSCTKCGKEKPLEEFARDKSRLDGRTYDCLACRRETNKARYQKNADKILADMKAARDDNIVMRRMKESEYRSTRIDNVRAANARHYAKNAEAYREKSKARYNADRIAINERVKAKRLLDPCKSRASTKKWKDANPEKVLAAKKRWLEKNPERARELQRASANKRRETAKGKIENAIRGGIKRGIIIGAKAGRKTFDLLGYSSDELRSHIERQFVSGMGWHNYGKGGWHIDHRVPLACFDYETPNCADFKFAWAITNLQPLWEAENHSKKDKRILLL